MEQFFTKIKRGMIFLLSWIAAILLVAMSFLVIYQVFTRYVLNSPSDFTEEIVRYLLIWTGFMGAAYGFCTRQHMALLLLHNKMTPEKRRLLLIFIDALIFAFALTILTVGGTKLAVSARKEFSALLGIYRSMVYSMAPVSGVFIMVAQIINIWEDVTGIVIKEEDK